MGSHDNLVTETLGAIGSFFSGPPGDPGQIRAIARRVDAVRSHAEDSHRTVDGAVAALTGRWQGQASRRFHSVWFSGDAASCRTPPSRSFAEVGDHLRALSDQLNQFADKLEHAQHEHWIQMGVLAAMLVVDAVQLGMDPATDAITAGVVAGEIGSSIALDVGLSIGRTVLLEGFKGAVLDIASQEGANVWDRVSGDMTVKNLTWGVNEEEVVLSFATQALATGLAPGLGRLTRLGMDNLVVDVSANMVSGAAVTTLDELYHAGGDFSRIDPHNILVNSVSAGTASAMTGLAHVGLERLSSTLVEGTALGPHDPVGSLSEAIDARLGEGFSWDAVRAQDAAFEQQVTEHATVAAATRRAADDRYHSAMDSWNEAHPMPQDPQARQAWWEEHAGAAQAARQDQAAAYSRAHDTQVAADSATEAARRPVSRALAYHDAVAVHDAAVREAGSAYDHAVAAAAARQHHDDMAWRNDPAHRMPDDPNGRARAEWRADKATAYAHHQEVHDRQVAAAIQARGEAVAAADAPLRDAMAPLRAAALEHRAAERLEGGLTGTVADLSADSSVRPFTDPGLVEELRHRLAADVVDPAREDAREWGRLTTEFERIAR